MRLVVGLQVLGRLQQGLHGLAGRWHRVGVHRPPAAKEALHGHAGVGCAEGELGKPAGAGLLLEGTGEVVELGVQRGGVAYTSGYLHDMKKESGVSYNEAEEGFSPPEVRTYQ